MLQIKRVYDEPSANDGYRVLIDRLWPRGLSKDKAKLDLWLKDIAPSNELRKWFNHEPDKWSDFKKKYQAELKNNAATKELKRIIKQHSKVTLLFGATDTQYNNAVALKDWLGR